MTLARNGTDCSQKAAYRKDRQETQSNQRTLFEAACFEIGMGWLNDLVEISNLLAQLSADAAYEQIAEAGHPSQHHRRTILAASIRLRQESQDDITLLHRFTSAAE